MCFISKVKKKSYPMVVTSILPHFQSDSFILMVQKLIFSLVSSDGFALMVFDVFYLPDGTPRPEGISTRWITLLIRRVNIDASELFTLTAICTCT